MKLRDGHFISIIDSTPLVSIDLILFNPEGKTLLGKRLNKPAQGFWFVPGGRIRKNETIKNAFDRISESELGVALPFESAKLHGAYDHIYDDNFSGLDEINTHYVVLGYTVVLTRDLPLQVDTQHAQFMWWEISALLADPFVHQNTKNYYHEQ